MKTTMSAILGLLTTYTYAYSMGPTVLDIAFGNKENNQNMCCKITEGEAALVILGITVCIVTICVFAAVFTVMVIRRR